GLLSQLFRADVFRSALVENGGGKSSATFPYSGRAGGGLLGVHAAISDAGYSGTRGGLFVPGVDLGHRPGGEPLGASLSRPQEKVTLTVCVNTALSAGCLSEE